MAEPQTAEPPVEEPPVEEPPVEEPPVEGQPEAAVEKPARAAAISVPSGDQLGSARAGHWHQDGQALLSDGGAAGVAAAERNGAVWAEAAAGCAGAIAGWRRRWVRRKLRRSWVRRMLRGRCWRG